MTASRSSDGARRATPADIEEILITRTGADPDVLCGQLHVALEDLWVDSLAVLELQAATTARFGVGIPDDALTMSTAALAAYINERLAGVD
jgi:acyl carrier protein